MGHIKFNWVDLPFLIFIGVLIVGFIVSLVKAFDRESKAASKTSLKNSSGRIPENTDYDAAEGYLRCLLSLYPEATVFSKEGLVFGKASAVTLCRVKGHPFLSHTHRKGMYPLGVGKWTFLDLGDGDYKVVISLDQRGCFDILELKLPPP